MCAIVGSSSKTKLEELFELNAYRGQLSYSLAAFDDELNLITLVRDAGKLPAGTIQALPEAIYYVGHSQAPTTESRNIHPASSDEVLLWHNGIVKQREIAAGEWDTQWMLSNITSRGFDFLSSVDGTFACIMYRSKMLHVFRNDISPLFIDDQLSISSTKFAGSRAIEPNTVFALDVVNMSGLSAIQSFTTMENPYFFG